MRGEAVSLEAICEDLIDRIATLGPAYQSVQVGPLAVWGREDCLQVPAGKIIIPPNFQVL